LDFALCLRGFSAVVGHGDTDDWHDSFAGVAFPVCS
jgi:hypothetical protein